MAGETDHEPHPIALLPHEESLPETRGFQVGHQATPVGIHAM